jgi:hypothetical protein
VREVLPETTRPRRQAPRYCPWYRTERNSGEVPALQIARQERISLTNSRGSVIAPRRSPSRLASGSSPASSIHSEVRQSGGAGGNVPSFTRGDFNRRSCVGPVQPTPIPAVAQWVITIYSRLEAEGRSMLGQSY